MSIQGQFYLLWLVVMVLAVALARRGRHDVRRVAAIVITAVTGASFVASVLLTAQSQQQAYFVTTTRIWEFGLGALLALGIGRLSVGGPRAAAASWVGLLGLLACGLVLPVESTFPGWVALWPVGCALLLLVSTREHERRWAATRLLSWPPLVRLGGVAFGIYLWHWPLLVLYRLRSSDGGHPDVLTGAAIIGASTVLALVTNRVIERPVLAGWSGGRRAVVDTTLVALWATVLAGGAAVQALHEHRTSSAARLAQDQREELDGCLGRAALEQPDRCADRLERTAVLPSRSALLEDTGGAYSCYTTADADRITSCRFGDGPRRVALIGSSHAAMFVPALRSRVDDLGWQVDTYTGNGCGWGPQRPEDPDVSDRCRGRLDETERRLLGGAPYDLVIFAGGRGNVGPDDTAERLATALTDLRRHGSTPVVVEDNPRIGESGARCVVTASDDELRGGGCDEPRERALAEPDLFAAAAREAAVPVVPTADLYCTSAECPAVIGNVIVYRDAHHLTATYVDTVMDAVLERIDAGSTGEGAQSKDRSAVDHAGGRRVRDETVLLVHDPSLGRGHLAPGVDDLAGADEPRTVDGDASDVVDLQLEGPVPDAGLERRVHGAAHDGVQQRGADAAVQRTEGVGEVLPRRHGELHLAVVEPLHAQVEKVTDEPRTVLQREGRAQELEPVQGREVLQLLVGQGAHRGSSPREVPIID